MVERVRFYFDPVCPWCYQTSRWARRLEELGGELGWGLFSLELQNAGREPEELARAHARSARALRTAVVVRDEAGAAGLGAFYKALGARVHEAGEPLEEAASVEAALADAGLEPAWCARAWSDASTGRQVAAEHRQLCERTRSFGVPTIVLAGGDGPAIFGPVISEVPNDDDAVELWCHTAWLVRHADFAELKRDRLGAPDLESVRALAAGRPGAGRGAEGVVSLTIGTGPFGQPPGGAFTIGPPDHVVYVERFARWVYPAPQHDGHRLRHDCPGPRGATSCRRRLPGRSRCASRPSASMNQ